MSKRSKPLGVGQRKSSFVPCIEHRAELEELEWPLAQAGPRLAEQHGRAELQPHEYCHNAQQRRQDHNRRSGNDEVKRPLHMSSISRSIRALILSTSNL